MNVQRFVIGSIVVFVYIFVYEWIFHGMLLQDMYAQTANLWRTEEEMWSKFHWLVLGQLIFAVMFCFIFTKGYENRGLAEGLRYGIFIALLFVGTDLIMYAVQPLSAKLLIAWMVGGIVEVAIAGTIMAAIYRPATS